MARSLSLPLFLAPAIPDSAAVCQMIYNSKEVSHSHGLSSTSDSYFFCHVYALQRAERRWRTGDAAILQQAEPYPRRLEGVQKDGCRPPDTGTNLQALPFFSTSGAWMAAPLNKKRLPHRHTTPLAMIL